MKGIMRYVEGGREVGDGKGGVVKGEGLEEEEKDRERIQGI